MDFKLLSRDDSLLFECMPVNLHAEIGLDADSICVTGDLLLKRLSGNTYIKVADLLRKIHDLCLKAPDGTTLIGMVYEGWDCQVEFHITDGLRCITIKEG